MTKRTDPLKNLVARVPGHCKCGAVRATISTSNPSSYALFCVNCYSLRGWIAPETFRFIAEVVRLCGRPIRPIDVRRGAMKEPTNK